MLTQKRYWLYLLVFAVSIYVVLPQLGSFRQGLHLLRSANLGWLLLGLLLSLFTHFLGAWKYWLLALRPVPLVSMWLVQMGSALANRLLPAGIGGMGVVFLYLRHEKHTNNQAAIVIAANDLLGFIGHMLLLAVLIFVAATTVPQVHVSKSGLFLPLLLIISCMALLVVILARKRLGQAAKVTWKHMLVYVAHPVKLVGGVFVSVLIALANAVIAWFAARALGLDVSFVVILLALTAGIAAGSASPTPGGLVGVEAAMVAALVLYNVPAPVALTITLLYRLLTFWFGLIVGAVVFWYTEKQGLFAT